LAKAAELREHGEDSGFIAKSLLNLNYRFTVWQKVIDATKRYLYSGHGSSEHARLVSAMREVERIESESECAKDRVDNSRDRS
tara:strand:- start:3741 stop:3989 length:249 start_codon:yes stop_codon:yes gene_type:complete